MWTDSLLRPLRLAPLADAESPVPASFAAKVLSRIMRTEPLVLVWWCFALSTLFSSITRFTAESSTPAYYALVIAGSGGCAWFWFLSRALFRHSKDLGPAVFSVVPFVMAIEAGAALMNPAGNSWLATEAGRIFGNAASLACIASIAFVCREAYCGYKDTASAAERRFSILYLAGFSLLVGITLVWASGASAGSFAAEWNAVLLTSCAFITVAGSRVAVQYRLRNPRQDSPRSERSRSAPTDDASSALLAPRIVEAINDETVLTTPNLKVSDFADRLGEQEYKVTRCITNHLQYRNFNHFLNSHRIDRAKRMFNDPGSRHHSIATIAYECGFNSIGPFNRAFKEFTGTTPREFRLQCGDNLLD